MGTTNDTIKRFLAAKESVRLLNQELSRTREREARSRSALIAALLNQRRELFAQSARAAFAGQQVDANALRAKVDELNQRLRKELLAEGYPEEYLQPVYECPICRDTGYVGEPVHELCVCMKQRIMDERNKGERKGGLGAHSFDQFDLSVFPDEPVKGERVSQREHMRRIERAARRYAEDFPDTSKPNLIFSGAAGVGKTFVADCIASRVMDRAFLVRRVTAYRMAEIMRKYQFDGSEARAAEDLQTCDLLFIDDLGTEPQTKNTSGYLFQVINERNNNDLHTIISTNIRKEQLATLYGERVASRLLDVSRTTVIEFYGRDLRLTPRT